LGINWLNTAQKWAAKFLDSFVAINSMKAATLGIKIN